MATYKGKTINTSGGQASISKQIASIDKGSTSTKSSSSGGSSKSVANNALVFDTPAYNAQFGGLTGEAQQKAISSYSKKNPSVQKEATAFASSFYNPADAIDAPVVSDFSNMTPPAFAPADNSAVATTANAFVGSLTAPAQMQTSYDTQVAEAEKSAQEQQNALTKMADKFSISDQYAKLQKQQGIPQMQKQLQEANIQLAQMQSQYQLQNQSLGQQTVPEAFVIGQQNELQKTAAITIGAQASYVQALQGNLELANHYVDKMTEMQYQDFQVKYENQKYNLEIAQNYLTKAEAKQAKAIDFQLDIAKTNYASFLDNKNQIWKNALSQGASSSELQSIARSQSDNDLAWAGQKYGMSAMEKAEISKIYGETTKTSIADTINAVFQKEGSNTPVTAKAALSALVGSDAVSTGTRARLAPAVEVLNAVDEFANANIEGEFVGSGGFLGFSKLKEWGKGIFNMKNPEAISNAQQIEAINLKVQQWASGAALTEDQTKQVAKITPNTWDSDKEIRTKSSQLYNFMLNQAEGNLLTEGINVQFPAVKLFEIQELYDKASPEQKKIIREQYFNQK